MRPANINKISRCFYITSRKYSEEKSVYQKHEEGPKPREVHGKLYPEWRKPWIHRDGEWSSKLSVFVEKNPSPDIMYALSQIPNLTFDKIKAWWSDMKVIQEKQNQKFLPERVATLGSNLAAVHFFTFRQAKVRLRGSSEWIFGDITTLNLPSNYSDGYYVEAIDCSEFHHNGIRFEGLENLYGLNFLKWLSLKNNRHVDVWCIDRIAGQNGKSLEYLDISGCNICVGCVFSLARMKTLKILIITDPGDNVELQAALSMLEQENPQLLIKAVENIDDNISK
ncbi:distal membrane-arm assembly complex protein 2 [Galleria mellonella]|uniref:Distal membrane-arm assembly complex protein 2 n=1 Tax=Galleria mellonella TaxID=7137 RepID=A0A6J1X5F6_GALME|nr:distal membrane-arm assembly complex protein 2 [Galleria mellonella]